MVCTKSQAGLVRCLKPLKNMTISEVVTKKVPRRLQQAITVKNYQHAQQHYVIEFLKRQTIVVNKS